MSTPRAIEIHECPHCGALIGMVEPREPETAAEDTSRNHQYPIPLIKLGVA